MKTLRIKTKEKIALSFVVAFVFASLTSLTAKSYLPLAYAAASTNNYPMSFSTALKVDLDIISVEEMRELRLSKSTLNVKI